MAASRNCSTPGTFWQLRHVHLLQVLVGEAQSEALQARWQVRLLHSQVELLARWHVHLLQAQVEEARREVLQAIWQVHLLRALVEEAQ